MTFDQIAHAFTMVDIFKPTRRPARKGRNPRTGEESVILASTTVKFTPEKALKDALK